METILFLDPVYVLALIASAIIVGALFDSLPRYAGSSAVLFTLFASSQLVFRILLHQEPRRLVGQLIYFLVFLLIVNLTSRFKHNRI